MGVALKDKVWEKESDFSERGKSGNHGNYEYVTWRLICFNTHLDFTNQQVIHNFLKEHNNCYTLNVSPPPPPNSYVGTLISNEIVFGDGAFGW